MAPTMTTRNDGRCTATTRGGRTGGQVSKGGGRTGKQGGRGNRANRGVDKVPNFSTVIAQYIHEDDRNVNVGNGRNRCSYKEFVACKPKEFDGKGGAVAYICRVEKIEAIQDINGCGDNQKVKYSAGSLTGRALTWWNSKVRTRGCEAVETEFLNHAMVGAGHSAYADQFHELARNGSLKRSGETKGDGRESSKEGNVKGDNKRARSGKVFATITNPVRKEYMGSVPKCTNCNFHHNLKTPCRACTNCNRLGHFVRDCKAVPRMVNLLNAKNLTAACGVCYECGGTDHYKSACPRLNRAP
ncbi:reverse transcriptase domain-containing protein [Tanacetum coccineum]